MTSPKRSSRNGSPVRKGKGADTGNDGHFASVSRSEISVSYDGLMDAEADLNENISASKRDHKTLDSAVETVLTFSPHVEEKSKQEDANPYGIRRTTMVSSTTPSTTTEENNMPVTHKPAGSPDGSGGQFASDGARRGATPEPEAMTEIERVQAVEDRWGSHVAEAYGEATDDHWDDLDRKFSNLQMARDRDMVFHSENSIRAYLAYPDRGPDQGPDAWAAEAYTFACAKRAAEAKEKMGHENKCSEPDAYAIALTNVKNSNAPSDIHKCDCSRSERDSEVADRWGVSAMVDYKQATAEQRARADRFFEEMDGSDEATLSELTQASVFMSSSPCSTPDEDAMNAAAYHECVRRGVEKDGHSQGCPANSKRYVRAWNRATEGVHTADKMPRCTCGKEQ